MSQIDKQSQESFFEAENLRKKKNFKEAINIYLEILKKYPNLLPVYNNIGLSYAELNNFEMAEKYFMDCLKFEPNNIAPLNNLAKLYFRNKKHKKAIPLYKKSLTLKADQPLIAEIFAESLFDLNLIKETNSFCEEALIRYPENIIIKFCYGKNLLKLNEHKKGLDFIKQSSGIIEFNEESFSIR